MPRKILTPQDADHLRSIANRLEETARRLRARAAAIVSMEILTLLVRDHQTAMDGMKKVEAYANNVDEAFYEAQRVRGDFGGTGTKNGNGNLAKSQADR